MGGYGRDFMGRMRGMWDRFTGHAADYGRDHGRRSGRDYGRDYGRRPMRAMGPGAEGYFLTPEMARDEAARRDPRDGGRDDPGALGSGAEGYLLTPQMVRDEQARRGYLRYDRGFQRYDRGYERSERGYRPGGMAQFGAAGAGRGYGGDFRTERGGRNAGEFFVNRQRGAGSGTGYRPGYEPDLGMRNPYDGGFRGRETGSPFRRPD